jgi:hypothetical protein
MVHSPGWVGVVWLVGHAIGMGDYFLVLTAPGGGARLIWENLTALGGLMMGFIWSGRTSE